MAGCGPAAERPIQGYIEGEYVRVAAPFAGALTQLSVKRGDPVATGAPLFALERENEIALRRQSEQQLQAALARLENLKSGKRPPEVETVAEQLRQAMATRDLAIANLDRQQKLYASGFVSAAVIADRFGPAGTCRSFEPIIASTGQRRLRSPGRGSLSRNERNLGAHLGSRPSTCSSNAAGSTLS